STEHLLCTLARICGCRADAARMLRGWMRRVRFAAQRGARSFAAAAAKEDSARLPLSKGMQTRLRELGYLPFTELQRKVCRPILEGRDVLAVAPAGRARLLAFLVPLLDRAKVERWALDDCAVVLAPSRREAERIYVAANALRKWSLRTVLVREGAEAASAALVRRGANLVVGTAQRVEELLREKAPDVAKVRVLVLEDAGQLVSQPALQGVLQLLKTRKCQRLALGDDVGAVQEHLGFRDPVLVDASSRPPLPLQAAHVCVEMPSSATKRARMLAYLLDEHLSEEDGQAKKALVFVRKGEAAQLAGHAMLRQRVLAVHEQMAPEEQQELLALFRTLPSSVLLGTDVALKGQNLPPVPLVLHLSSPPTPDIYLSRVARLGASKGRRSSSAHGSGATSLLLFGPHEVSRLRDLERELGFRLTAVPAPSESAVRSAALQAVTKELQLAARQYDAAAFEPDAEQQLELHGPRLLAAALVLLERRRRGEEWLSPLSGRPRYTPLLLADPHLEKLRTRQSVAAALRRALKAKGAAVGESQEKDTPQIGRIELTRKGWLVDVPRGLVPLLLEGHLRLGDWVGAAEEEGCRCSSVGGSSARFLYPSGRRTLFGAGLSTSRMVQGGKPTPTAGRRAEKRRGDFCAGRKAGEGTWQDPKRGAAALGGAAFVAPVAPTTTTPALRATAGKATAATSPSEAPKALAVAGAVAALAGRKAPVGFFDPFGLTKDGDTAAFQRRRATELKNGRVAMLATMGYITPEYVRFPGFCSPSEGVKFADVPNGLAALGKVPAGGWMQILLFLGLVEKSLYTYDPTRAPGDFKNAGVLGVPNGSTMAPGEGRNRKLNSELANGRLAMMAIMGMFFQDGLTGSAWGDWANYVDSPLRAFENELGVQAPVGYFDPLGMSKDGDVTAFKRRRESELKNGRVAMFAAMGFITPEYFRFPGYLSPAKDLKFADVPNGLAALGKVPFTGWIQIFLFCGMVDFGLYRADESRDPGDYANGGILGVPNASGPMADSEGRKRKLNSELANGRLAMMAITGMLFQNGITGTTGPAMWGF
ncbi:unnamed protein product, partial [Effrenium voratum]